MELAPVNLPATRDRDDVRALLDADPYRTLQDAIGRTDAWLGPDINYVALLRRSQRSPGP